MTTQVLDNARLTSEYQPLSLPYWQIWRETTRANRQRRYDKRSKIDASRALLLGYVVIAPNTNRYDKPSRNRRNPLRSKEMRCHCGRYDRPQQAI